MKKILGLDIGTSSIGWAIVHEDEHNEENNKIVAAGVRIIPMGDEEKNFIEGKPVTLNADRRNFRTIRRNNQRYKLRRHRLIEKLSEMGMMPDDRLLKGIKILDLYKLRDQALKEKLSKQEIGRIFYQINQRRGYKSNRKANKESETDFTQEIIDRSNMVSGQSLTIGQYFYQELLRIKETPDPNFKIRTKAFLREDYLREFEKIWDFQAPFYPEILNETNRVELRDRIIFYQRRLKSQKGLVSDCRFEKHHKAVPKSSPFFQLFNMYSKVNNLEIVTRDGEVIEMSEEKRKALLDHLNDHDHVSKTELLEIIGCKPVRRFMVNYEKVEGNRTRAQFLKIFQEHGYSGEQIEQSLRFDPFAEKPDQEPLYRLWHLIYSAEDDEQLVKSLQENFGVPAEVAVALSKIGYSSQFGSLSARAIRKLLPALMKGNIYSDACTMVGYNHSDSETKEERDSRVLHDNLPSVKRNELRNPVVEKVANQVITLINSFIKDKEYGRPDEIRVELARSLKENAKERQRITKTIAENEKENERVKNLLMTEWGFKKVSKKDIIKYRLWQETGGISIYTGKPIQKADIFDKSKIDVEHIIPRALLFDDSYSNKTLCETWLNKEKDKATAYDFMENKSADELERYKSLIKQLYDDHRISKSKFSKLMMKAIDLPDNFIDRQLRETQYINREITSRLKTVCRNVVSTSGSITDYLRNEWGLDTVLQELNVEKYRAMGQTYYDTDHTDKPVEKIKDWTKRADHRHHALDAIVIASTKQGMIQKLNTLHQRIGGTQDELKEYLSENESWRIRTPWSSIRPQTKHAINHILVSFKSDKKVVTRHINKIKVKNGEIRQVTFTPRGFLHKETIYGKVNRYRKIKLDKKMTPELFESMSNPYERFLVEQHLEKYNRDFDVAFSSKTLKKDPVMKDRGKKVPLEMVTVYDPRFVYRVKLDNSFKNVDDVVDEGIKKVLIKRLEAFNNDPKKAFNDLENNPVWFNEEKKIPVKTVRIFGPVSLQPIHTDGNGSPKDFVHTRNNHHVAIYENGDGKRKEKVVTLWEAVERRKQGLPVIDKEPEEGWRFLTSMQINDLFVFNLDPKEIDFFDPNNKSLISKNFYRVQKLSTEYYVFRHHLETTLKNDSTLIRIQSLEKMTGIKVVLDNFGRVVKVGES